MTPRPPALLTLLILALIPIGIILLGMLGYMLIEGWSWMDALYMSVITLTTVGFREVREMSRGGIWFTMFLALGGIFTLFYAATTVIATLVRGDVQRFLEFRRMEKRLAELKDHVIVCGYGRMGKNVCQEFSARGVEFVLIDKSPEIVEEFRLTQGIPIHGDATQDDVLKRARVDSARALVAVAASDADNLYITMSARLLNDRLFIVSRASDDACEVKMQRAGASRVVSPYTIGGFRVAQAILRPTVVDFIELATRSEHLELNIEETRILPKSVLAGMSLQKSQIRERLGVIVVGIKKSSGHMVFNPSADAMLEANDILIMLGRRADLDELQAMSTG